MVTLFHTLGYCSDEVKRTWTLKNGVVSAFLEIIEIITHTFTHREAAFESTTRPDLLSIASQKHLHSWHTNIKVSARR